MGLDHGRDGVRRVVEKPLTNSKPSARNSAAMSRMIVPTPIALPKNDSTIQVPLNRKCRQPVRRLGFPGSDAACEPSMSIRKRLVLAVMLGVMLARFAGMVRGMGGMAVSRMGMVRGGLMRIRLVMLGCLTMMLGGVLVMFGCGVMMFDNLVFGR